MKGKRFATSTCSLAVALVGRQEGQADAFLHDQSGSIASTRRQRQLSSCSLVGGSASSTMRISPVDLSANRRAYHAVAFEGSHNFGHSGRNIRALSAATLDLSASASSNNEHLHTSSSSDDNSNENTERPRPMVICGPSGVGKGTLIDAILHKKFPASKFGFSVSHTTRAPRPGEIDGVHYHFVSVEQIKQDIADGKFLEYAQVHGNYYGTSLEAVESVRREGKLCLLDIDVQGVRTIKSDNKLPDALYVFVAPPSVETLEERLRGRGTETEEALARRLGNARAELEYGRGEGNFDMVLVNGSLDAAVEELADQMRGWYPTTLDAEERN